jgi:hypothetical protein
MSSPFLNWHIRQMYDFPGFLAHSDYARPGLDTPAARCFNSNRNSNVYLKRTSADILGETRSIAHIAISLLRF